MRVFNYCSKLRKLSSDRYYVPESVTYTTTTGDGVCVVHACVHACMRACMYACMRACVHDDMAIINVIFVRADIDPSENESDDESTKSLAALGQDATSWGWDIGEKMLHHAGTLLGRFPPDMKGVI